MRLLLKNLIKGQRYSVYDKRTGSQELLVFERFTGTIRERDGSTRSGIDIPDIVSAMEQGQFISVYAEFSETGTTTTRNYNIKDIEVYPENFEQSAFKRVFDTISGDEYAAETLAEEWLQGPRPAKKRRTTGGGARRKSRGSKRARTNKKTRKTRRH